MSSFSVYLVTNTVNGKGYVGLTGKTVESRWRDHIITAYRRKKKYALHHAIVKHGAESFVVETVAIELTREDAKELETRLIAEYDTRGHGYNMTGGGDGAVGLVVDDCQREEMRKRVIAAHAEKRVGMHNKRHSEETKKKISAANTGKTRKKREIRITARLTRAQILLLREIMESGLTTRADISRLGDPRTVRTLYNHGYLVDKDDGTLEVTKLGAYASTRHRAETNT